MKHLRSLSISSSTEDDILDLHYLSDPPPSLSRLQLYGRLHKLPDCISKLQNIVKLRLWKSRFSRDPIEVLGSLPSLLELELLETHAMEELCFEAKGFQKLKVLRICGLMELKRVKIQEGAMAELENLEIGLVQSWKRCPMASSTSGNLKLFHFVTCQKNLHSAKLPGRGRNYGIIEHIRKVFLYQRLSGQHYTLQTLLLAVDSF